MDSATWWKNFALGMELDASGAFIYNGAKYFHDMKSLNNSIDIFEVLYNLSVGIERLFKVSIILLEHHSDTDMKALEDSLRTHKVTELAIRIQKLSDTKFSNIQMSFLNLLSNFYEHHRYNRFSIGNISCIEQEKVDFINFLTRHFSYVPPSNANSFLNLPLNTSSLRKSLGKLIYKITKPVFNLIEKSASAQNIYTYELRGDSKAIKVFCSFNESVDFLDEDYAKREIILFLLSNKNESAHIKFLKTLPSLELDDECSADYIRQLLNDKDIHSARDEVDALIEEKSNKERKERFDMLDIIDNEHFDFYDLE